MKLIDYYNINNIIYNKLYLIIVLFIFRIVLFNNQSNDLINPTNIPELLYYKHQKLYILAEKNKANDLCPLTLYFSLNFTDNNVMTEYEIKQINLKDKNYFVSFYGNNLNYIEHFKILNENGLIRSKYIHGNNNLFISPVLKSSFKAEKENLYDLSNYQKVYQYISGNLVFNKNSLYTQYIRLKNLFFLDFDYMPKTYNYPEDKYLIEKKFSNYKLNLSDLWLVKPIDKYGGEGIKFLKSLKDITFNEFIITQYISNIDLIKGKKYDLRLYILISGLKPLRIYFYEEGLVRIASEKYSSDINNIGNKFMHLTNTDVNKYNKNFIHPNDSNSNNENANEWNLLMYKKYLKEKHNFEWDDIRIKIKDIIIKTIISLQYKLIELNDKEKLDDKNFYNLLGFDILMTNNFIPILLEVNFSPCMFIYNNLERPIKKSLFIDTLNIIGISPYSRKTNKPLNKHPKNNNNKYTNINNALCELSRPRGSYELIFPLKANINKYKKYFINISEENNEFWNKILDN